MKLLMLLIVLAANQTFAVKITSNGLQRVTKGDKCTFRWTVDEPITSYTIYNRTTGYLTALDRNGYQDYDNSSGVITLVLNNVQMRDAGNYSLEIVKGSNTVIDSTACLFVYGPLEGNLVLTFGSNPPTEGDTVELTCNLTSTSMPVAYRPEIQYTWKLLERKIFEYISSGPVTLWNGDEVVGYTIKNNGRTLRIGSIRYPGDQDITCVGLEEGSNVKQYNTYSRGCRRSYWRYWSKYDECNDYGLYESCYDYGITKNLQISMRYRPYINFSPSSKKFNAVIGQPVVLSFSTSANPSITSTTNWTFVNSAGILQKLPPQSTAGSTSIRFNLTSTAYYGYYSISVTNENGSTTATFQVLSEGPPDAPSNVRLKYVSHREIAIQYNLMHSNSGKHSQRIYLRLKLSEGGSTAESSSVIYLSESFNSTYSYNFTKNIQPETKYEVNVWSVNGFGSSEVVQLEVRTRKQAKLQVSPETISIEGTRAVIDFTVELGGEQVVRVEAQCCSLLSEQCSNYSGIYNGNQVAVKNIPDGTVYFIDLIIYSGIHNMYYYYSDAVRGLRVPRSRNERNSHSPLTAAVIVPSVLGTIFFALNAVLIIYLLIRRRRNRQSDKPVKDHSNTGNRERAEERPQPDEDNTYEDVEMVSQHDNHYYEDMKKGRRQLKTH